MTNICFLDTKTAGLHPGKLVWEVAMILRRPDGLETQSVFQISNIDVSEADPNPLKINSFYDRYYRYLDDQSTVTVHSEFEAAAVIERMTRGAHIIGAVRDFDTEILDKLLRKHGFLPSWHYHLINVESLAVGYLMGRNSYTDRPVDPTSDLISLPWKSDELSRAIGVEPSNDDERHTALGDALWAKRTYDKVMGIG